MPTESYTVTGLFEGHTVSELTERTLDKLRQRPGNHDRYPRPMILRGLNDGQVEAARKLRCLRSFAVIELKAGYSQYRPPSQMLIPDKAFFFKSATSYYELEQKTRAWLDKHKRGWRTVDGDPLIVYPGDSYGNLRKLGFYPTPDTDGDSYTASPDTGIVVSETGATISGNVTGTNNAASSTVCTDTAGRTLSDEGVLVGMTAVNVTDGSSGQISDVTGSTFTVSLSGGTNNAWAVGDSFAVLAGEYGVVTGWNNTNEQYLFSSEIGEMADVSTLTNNVYIEFIRRPLPLQFDSQKPEIPPEAHIYLPDYAVWYCKRSAPKSSEDYSDAQIGKAAFDAGIADLPDSDRTEDDCVGDYHL